MSGSDAARAIGRWGFAFAVLAGGCAEEALGDRGLGSWEPGAGEDADASVDDPGDLPPVTPIYGGTDVAACGWPTTVNLGGSCSGTLVAPNVVIYAAHCGDDYDTVRLGEKAYSGAGRWISTQFCKTYPGGGPGGGDDFAVCKLAQSVTDVPIVPILMGCETSVLQPGHEVTLVGFGEANTGPYGVKREVTTTIKSLTSNGEIRIGGGGQDTCQGDSGGPAFVQLEDGSWRVFGITSYGGACGTGGYYSMMHNGIAWFESQTGVDLTPCHDADGTWNPTAACGSFPYEPGDGHGTWGNGCGGGPVSGYSDTCGGAYGGGGGGGGPAPEPEPDPDDGACPGCESYSGQLSGSKASALQPDGNYWYAAAGSHHGVLTGPAGADFDLYLYKWSSGKWNVVAKGEQTGSEDVAYAGTAGYYIWMVYSYSGGGSYTLQLARP